MQDASLLKRSSQRPMQPILKIEIALPLDDVGEQVAIKSGVLGQQGTQVEVPFGGDELFEPDHARWDVGPVPSRLESVWRVGTPVAHGLEDHRASLGGPCPACRPGTGPEPFRPSDSDRSVDALALAEDRGFEPLRAFTQRAFQARALGHYANPPSRRLPEGEPHSTIGRQHRNPDLPGHSSRVDADPPRGGTSPNSPRAGRQQGQVSSSRCAGGPSCSDQVVVSGEPTRLGPVSTALYRRYRPESFAEIIGQDHVTEPLMQALRTERVSHAYLFSGPRG